MKQKEIGKVEERGKVLGSYYPNVRKVKCQVKMYQEGERAMKMDRFSEKVYRAVGGSATNTSGTRYRGRRGSSSSILIRVMFF